VWAAWRKDHALIHELARDRTQNRFPVLLIAHLESRLCFVPDRATKQNSGRMKPFSAFGEDLPKPALVNTPANETTGCKGPRQGTVMIKALSAIAIAAFVAAALTVLPGFAPQVEASTPQALAKADRLDVRPVGRDCSQQAWPNFEASCLRAAVTKTSIREARLVTADRAP
jgi:hypothetical protein